MATLFACNTPTIPIPPPSPDPDDVVVSQYPLDATKLVFEGSSDDGRSTFAADALVTVFNDDTEGGVLATSDANGEFVTDPLTAAVGDRVRIWFETEDGGMSGELCLIVSLGRQDDGNLCPL